MSQLLFEQLEFANLIVLNKTDQISAEDRGRIRSMLSRFNPEADIVETSFGKIDPALLFGVARFDLQNAAAHPQWLKEARIGEHKPESEEYGISSFTFRAKVPLHPLRLHDAMMHALKLTEEESPLKALVRMKGVAWIATHPELQAMVALAGKAFSVAPGPPWWAVVPREEWPPGLDEAIKPLWHEPHGDRQVELVCIGQYMDKAAVDSALRACLVTDEELLLGEEAMCELPDPFHDEWNTYLEISVAQAADEEGAHERARGDSCTRSRVLLLLLVLVWHCDR